MTLLIVDHLNFNISKSTKLQKRHCHLLKYQVGCKCLFTFYSYYYYVIANSNFNDANAKPICNEGHEQWHEWCVGVFAAKVTSLFRLSLHDCNYSRTTAASLEQRNNSIINFILISFLHCIVTTFQLFMHFP